MTETPQEQTDDDDAPWWFTPFVVIITLFALIGVGDVAGFVVGRALPVLCEYSARQHQHAVGEPE